MNYYAILGVSRDATPEEIRQAYFTAARRLHPDVNRAPNAGDLFLAIQQAYETLSNPEKRAVYDEDLSPDSEVSPIELNIIFSRPTLIPLDEPQLIFAYLEIKAAQLLEETSSPALNVCLVLDRSTSMRGARLDNVKDTAIEIIHHLRADDILSIVTFSDQAQVVIPARYQFDKRTAENSIHMLRASGSTEIYRGLETGFNEVRRNLRQSFVNHLILITDGRTYGDEQACLELADQCAAMGIGISALGIGSQWNDDFLEKLTTRAGGDCTYITTTTDIAEILKKKIRSLGHIFAEGVVLDVTTGPQVKLSYAFRLEPEASNLERTLPLQLGSIHWDNPLRVILELLVPAVSDGTRQIPLLEGSLRLNIPNQEIPVYNMRLFLSRPVDENLNTEPPPAEIMTAMEQLTLYRIQEKARQEAADGDITNATRHLHYLASRLLSRGQHALAQTVLSEADHLQRESAYSQDGEKAIKYGTKALLLPDITNGRIT